MTTARISQRVAGSADDDRGAFRQTSALPLNGSSLNGSSLNGIPLNGIPLNGIPLNGIPLNGIPSTASPQPLTTAGDASAPAAHPTSVRKRPHRTDGQQPGGRTHSPSARQRVDRRASVAAKNPGSLQRANETAAGQALASNTKAVDERSMTPGPRRSVSEPGSRPSARSIPAAPTPAIRDDGRGP
jgi:hypothetical protein